MYIFLITYVFGCLLQTVLSSGTTYIHGTGCKLHIYTNGIHADCGHLKLTGIPDICSSNVTSIDLSFNNIDTVRNDSFASCNKLLHLNLHLNKITKLETLAFNGCNTLRNLDLSSNLLSPTYESFPSTSFDNLARLERLILTYNPADHNSFPDRIFRHLQNLQILEIDTDVFGEGFAQLYNLHKLHLCIGTLRNDTFHVFKKTRLEILVLTKCIDAIEPGAFTHLIHLKELYWRGSNKLGIKMALQSLSGLIGRAMRIISIEKSKLRVHLSPKIIIDDVVVEREDLKYLSQICTEKLSLARCGILYIDFLSLTGTNFSECISYLDVSRNSFYGDATMPFLAFQGFNELKYLDISHKYCDKFSSSSFIDKEYENNEEHENKNIIIHTGLNISVQSITKFQFKFPMHIRLPGKIQFINASYLDRNVGYLKENVTTENGQFLLEVNMSFTGLKYILGNIYGVPNIKVLDLSGNSNLRLSDSFFDSLSSLESLHLSYYSLQENVLSIQGKRLLRMLSNLRCLYLAHNRLSKIEPNLFERNPLLQYLDLSGNMFSSIPVDSLDTPNFQILNMKDNSISYLAAPTRKTIDKFNIDGTFKILLQGNIFSCACESLDFLLWNLETETVFDNKTYPCLLDSGEMSSTPYTFAAMYALWRHCMGIRIFYISLLLCILSFCGFLTFSLARINKTKIVNIFINLLRKQIPKPNRTDYQQDLYISYADLDYKWVCHHLRPLLEDRHLRLYVWHRDSVPGDSVPDQIAENIQNSYKTLLYLTNNYETDPWSYMSMMVAINCVDNLNPERLILLLSEGEHPRIPNCLLDVVPECCIFRVPDNAGFDDPIWEDLAALIRK